MGEPNFPTFPYYAARMRWPLLCLMGLSLVSMKSFACEPCIILPSAKAELKETPDNSPSGAIFLGYSDQHGGCAFMDWYDIDRQLLFAHEGIIQGIGAESQVDSPVEQGRRRIWSAIEASKTSYPLKTSDLE